MESLLKEYLSKHEINFISHKHKAVFTVKESHSNPDIIKIPGLRTKNLFLKNEKRDFYLISMPGEKRLDIKSLKIKLAAKELHFASPEELKSELGLTPGSVSIFGMINAKNVLLVIDEEVWNADITGFHPNINTETLEIKHKDLEKFVNSLNCKHIILKL
jgi:Ala-tRNA(Pro) deacylase